MVYHVAAFIAATGTLGQRRATGASIAESGTTRGPGAIHRLSQHSFEASEGFRIALVSTAVQAVIAFTGRAFCDHRAALGVVRDVVARARVLVSCGLIRATV